MIKNRRYSLSQQCLAYALLVSLFLQSCYNQAHAPEGDNFPQSASFMATNQEGALTREPAPDNHTGSLLTLQVGETKGKGIKRINSQQLLKEVSKKEKKEQPKELDTFSTFPKEVWQHILSYVPAEHIGKIRQVNRTFYRLTTGYQQPGLIGVANKPAYHIKVDSWMISKLINFEQERFKELTPSTVPSLLFYQFLAKARSLPQSFWPYLEGTHIEEIDLWNNHIGDSGAQTLAKELPNSKIHTLNLWNNQIGDSGAQALAMALHNSKIHTLDLSRNQIGDSGAQALAKALPNSQIHTLDLSRNQIGDSGTQELAKALPNSQIHTLYLGDNRIGDSGAQELAKALPNSHIHTLYLSINQIGDSGAQELAKALPNSQIHTLNLGSNQIGDSGAQALAMALPNSHIHTFNLWDNRIGYSIKKLLSEQFPNIQWVL